jgi:HD-like signal output (HDOD) protein
MSTTPTPLEVALADPAALPLLPPGVLHLLNALRADDLGNRELTLALRNFPPIVARVVALANSVWATPREPVTNLFGACALLGLNVVRSVCIALAVARPFNASSCPAFDAKRFWLSALLTAEGAVLLRPLLAPRCDVNTLGTAGLLHNLGLLGMAHASPQATQAGLDAAAQGEDLAAALRAASSTDYCEVGAALGQAWKLPSELTLPMRHHRGVDYRGPHEALVANIAAAAALVGALLREGSVEPDESDLRIGALPREAARAAFDQLARKRRPFDDLAKTLFAR